MHNINRDKIEKTKEKEVKGKVDIEKILNFSGTVCRWRGGAVSAKEEVEFEEEEKIEKGERRVIGERIHQGLRKSTVRKISIYTNTLIHKHKIYTQRERGKEKDSYNFVLSKWPSL